MSTNLTMIGNLTKDAEAGEGNRPSKFRMAAYVSGKGDDKKSAFLTVKVFDLDPAALDNLRKGTRVMVTGRLDVWETSEGNQVIDMVANEVAVCCYKRRDDDNGRSSSPRQPARASRSRDDDESF